MYKNWQYWSIMTVLMAILGQLTSSLLLGGLCLVFCLWCLYKMIRSLD